MPTPGTRRSIAQLVLEPLREDHGRKEPDLGGLAGQHHYAVVGRHQQRLVAGCVAGSRDDDNAWSDLRLAVDHPQVGTLEIARVLRVGVVGRVRVVELDPLDVDGHARELVVAARVVGVHVAVDDRGDQSGSMPLSVRASRAGR